MFASALSAVCEIVYLPVVMRQPKAFVIEGFGAREFATSFQRALLDVRIGRQHESSRQR